MSELLTTEQAARYCGMSPRTFEKFRCNGRGPVFVKLGHSVKYKIEDLKAWIDERRKRSTSDPGPQARQEAAADRAASGKVVPRGLDPEALAGRPNGRHGKSKRRAKRPPQCLGSQTDPVAARNDQGAEPPRE